MEHRFGRQATHMCELLIWIYRFIDHHFCERLLNIGHCLRGNAKQFAGAIYKRGTVGNPNLQRVVGFIDGTLRPCARLAGHDNVQANLFSGHKRVHGLKFLAATVPNGLIAILSGPIPGRRHDAYLYRRSGMFDSLVMLLQPEGESHIVRLFFSIRHAHENNEALTASGLSRMDLLR